MHSLDITMPIHCYRFGLMKQVKQWDTTGEKTITKNLFIMLTEGSACFCVNGQECHLQVGSVLIIPAHTPYTTATEDFCSYFYFHFSGAMEPCPFPIERIQQPRSFSQDLAPIEYDRIYLPHFITLERDFNRIHHRLINCTEYASHGTHAGRLLLNNEIYKILLTIAEIVELEQKQNTLPLTLDKIILYIRKNLTKPLSLKNICDNCNISPSYVERLFKKHLGMTVTEYINTEKLYFACELIRSSQLNLTEIAAYLGYSDVSYFSRRFKRKFGKSPSQMFPRK